jgi:hypothetical protein
MATPSHRQYKRLELDGDWGLLEFSGFGKHYVQLYAFFYGVRELSSDGAAGGDERVLRAFASFPWKGGWSAVDFFENLRYAIPRKDRVRIKEIEFASPGHIDLWALASATGAITATVTALTLAVNRVHNTYRNIQKGIREHKLGKIDVRRAELALAKEQLAFIDASIEDLSEGLKLAPEDLDTIKELSPQPLGTLKILLAVYRRARELAKMQANGQIKF